MLPDLSQLCAAVRNVGVTGEHELAERVQELGFDCSTSVARTTSLVRVVLYADFDFNISGEKPWRFSLDAAKVENATKGLEKDWDGVKVKPGGHDGSELTVKMVQRKDQSIDVSRESQVRVLEKVFELVRPVLTSELVRAYKLQVEPVIELDATENYEYSDFHTYSPAPSSNMLSGLIRVVYKDAPVA